MRDAPWPMARALARQAAATTPVEQVAIEHAVDRILADDLTARCPLPGFDTSAMDGWAVGGDPPWQVVGQVLAGAAPTMTLHAGQAVMIATGAATPDGTTAVLRREFGVLDPGAGHATVRAEPIDPGTDIRPTGEECAAGEIVAAAGQRVSPALAGLLAATGHDTVPVRRRPQVALLVVGDELLTSGLPQVGQVRDSLGPQLPGWVAQLGGHVSRLDRVPDTVDDLVGAIRAVLDSDLILTTGGTAAGPVDHLHAALHQLDADLLLDAVAVRPGHPMLLARSGDTPVIGLPGNPQSAVIGLLTLAAPLLRGQLGEPEPDLPVVRLAGDLTAPAAEHRLVASTLSPDRIATPVRHLGSAMLRGLAAAAGFAVVPPGGASHGTEVPWLALP